MHLVDAMTEKGHRCAAAIQRAFMRGGIDSLGQPANDAKTSPAEIPGWEEPPSPALPDAMM